MSGENRISAPSYTTLSFLSSKGGVGKTLLAINTACELARAGLDVLLIDFDVYNYGSTLWFRKNLQRADPSTITLSWILKEFKSNRNDLKNLNSQAKGKDIFKIDLAREDNFVYFLPCFVPKSGQNTQFQSDIAQSAITAAPAAGEFLTLLKDIVPLLVKKYRCKFVIFDGHPGVVSLAAICSAISDCSIVVTDFDEATFFSSVVFSALVENYIEEHHFADKRYWRIVVNKLPSAQEGVLVSKRLNDAIELANSNSGINDIFPRLKEGITHNFDEELVNIPDLEEFRDPNIEKEQEGQKRGSSEVSL